MPSTQKKASKPMAKKSTKSAVKKGSKKATSTKKSAKKASAKKTDIVKVEDKQIELIDDDDDDDVEDVEFDAEEDEFFDKKNFKEFGENIKFRVFDPERYETELHKEIIIVPKNYRKTSEIITKYEFTDVVSNRAKQIENGSRIFVDIGDEDNPIKMAEMEIRKKRCPLSVRRMISNNIAEIWDVNEMSIPY